MTTALTAPEKKSLAKCERVIEKGLATFVEVGQALFDIREGKLHRSTHDVFEDYCKERWEIAKSHAYRLIASAEAVANLSPMGDVLPASERQARPLTTIPMEKQGEVWQEAVETAPKDDEGNPIITGKHVEETVKRFKEPEPWDTEGDEPAAEVAEEDTHEPPCDQFGNVWTDAAYADVLDSSEANQHIKELQAIRRQWKKWKKENHGLTRQLEISSLDRQIGFAIQTIKEQMPHCLCPACDGEGCKFCKQRGWVDANTYKLVPEEKKYRELS